jgi:hypothetical protein
MSISLTNQCVNLVGFLRNHFKDDRWRVDKYNFLMHLDSSTHSALRTSPSLLQGFVDIFQIIEKCLEEKNIPTAENILQCVNERSTSLPHTQEYLQHAGTQKGCHAALNLLFNAARKQDQKAGDGECQRRLGQSWSVLPACRNDHEFKFVAKMRGCVGDGIW